MKLNCGESITERYERLESWHPWFAWRPVRIASHDCRWLEWVERRGIRYSTGVGLCWVWEYRAEDGKHKAPESA